MTHTPYFQRTCFHSSIGVHVEKMIFKLSDWFQWEIDIPTLPEQEKIAGFLGAVDGKLVVLRDKHKGLERFKRGLMQKLFSRTLRFTRPDGTPYPDWEEITAGQTFKSHTNKNHNSDLPILAATQDQGMIFREDTGLDIKSSVKSVESYKIVEPGDFVISLRSFQGGIEYSTIRGICSPAYIILKPTVEICSGFFKQYFKKERFINRLNGTVTGIRDGKQIPYSAFSSLKLLIPSLEEQQKIADALSTFDAKIATVSDQITRLETFKRGLLQKMFV